MSRIIINYNGWLEADPAEIHFVKLSGLETVDRIRGDEWLELPEQERDEYIIETSHDKVEATSLDGEFTDYWYEVD